MCLLQFNYWEEQQLGSSFASFPVFHIPTVQTLGFYVATCLLLPKPHSHLLLLQGSNSLSSVAWGWGEWDSRTHRFCWDLVHAQDHWRLYTAAYWQRASWKGPDGEASLVASQQKPGADARGLKNKCPIAELCCSAPLALFRSIQSVNTLTPAAKSHQRL